MAAVHFQMAAAQFQVPAYSCLPPPAAGHTLDAVDQGFEAAYVLLFLCRVSDLDAFLLGLCIKASLVAYLKV